MPGHSCVDQPARAPAGTDSRAGEAEESFRKEGPLACLWRGAMDLLSGTTEQFESLLENPYSLGRRILLDAVPNHCYSGHPLFQAALAAGPAPRSGTYSTSCRAGFRSPTTALLLTLPGSLADVTNVPPNNWQSASPAAPGAAQTGVRDGHPLVRTPTLNRTLRREAGPERAPADLQTEC
jgi:hypothetical protein